MDEQETSSEFMEGVEVQPVPNEVIMADELPMDTTFEAVEESEGVSFPVSVADVEDALEDSGTSAETPDTLASERVEEIVDALLQSDKVNQFFNSMEYALQTIAEAGEREPEEVEQVLEVVPVEDVLDRMTVRVSEEMPVSAVPAASEPTAQLMEAGGEVLVPGAEELTVIEVLQSILEYFQEDDNSLLTDIKTLVTDIKVNTEPHLLLDTPFEDYTVVEGLLLILVLWLVVLKPCVSMIKGGFSWLL